MSPGQIVLFIIGTVAIIIGAYYVTYYVGVKSTKLRRGAGRSIILRDRFAISKDKSFCLVEICGKVYIVGVTNQSVTLLDTIKTEDLEREEKEQQTYQGGVYQNNMINAAITWLIALKNKRRVGDERKVNGTFAERMKAAVRSAEEDNMCCEEKQQMPQAEDREEPSGPEGTE